jgi:hypothetical protein
VQEGGFVETSMILQGGLFLISGWASKKRARSSDLCRKLQSSPSVLFSCAQKPIKSLAALRFAKDFLELLQA